MSQEIRKHWTAGEKVAILHEHLVGRVAISDVCNQHQLKPTQFYRWQKEFFENGALAFDRDRRGSNERKLERQLAVLEAKIARRNALIAELLEGQFQIQTNAETASQ